MAVNQALGVEVAKVLNKSFEDYMDSGKLGETRGLRQGFVDAYVTALEPKNKELVEDVARLPDLRQLSQIGGEIDKVKDPVSRVALHGEVANQYDQLRQQVLSPIARNYGSPADLSEDKQKEVLEDEARTITTKLNLRKILEKASE